MLRGANAIRVPYHVVHTAQGEDAYRPSFAAFTFHQKHVLLSVCDTSVYLPLSSVPIRQHVRCTSSTEAEMGR